MPKGMPKNGLNKGWFKKGKPSAFKSRNHSAESCFQMSLIRKGQHNSIKTEFKKGLVPWNKGKRCPQISGHKNGFFNRHHSQETKKKISEAHKGIPLKHSGQFKKGYPSAFIGHRHKPESLKKMRISAKNRIGIKANNWQGGKTSKSMALRNSNKYKEWRKEILRRDSYSCIECGQVGGELIVHHIKSFSKYPELRFDINNGITLCCLCHQKTDNFLWKAIGN